MGEFAELPFDLAFSPNTGANWAFGKECGEI
jgi:hypothetical protein